MIYDASSTIDQREIVLDHCKKRNFDKVVDIGGSLNPWAKEVVTHYVDLIPPPEEEQSKPFFPVDISNPLTWNVVLNHVKTEGKFDFAICTQTLEHVTSVELALHFMTQIAHSGFIGVPNKFVELSPHVAMGMEGLIRCKINNFFKGFLPHRWIFTIIMQRGELVICAFLKLNFIETMHFDWVAQNFRSQELSFFWERTIPNFIVDDTIIDRPDPQSAIEYYYNNLKGGI